MRKSIWILVGASFLSSCVNDVKLEDLEGDVGYSVANSVAREHRVSVSEAEEIATSFFTKASKRMSPVAFEIDYIVKPSIKRGLNVYDTLAYVFNGNSDDGFVVVATDDRVFPILAMSREGRFVDEKGSIVDEEFVGRLSAYYEANSNEPENGLSVEEMLDGCYSQIGSVPKSWSQSGSFNKYVEQEHPGSPAGCVAVATAMVMSRCETILNYHDHKFYLWKIHNAFKEKDRSYMSTVDRKAIVGGNLTPYTYDEAVDEAAKLLYWIGKDVNMNYMQGLSTAFSSDAYYLLKDLDFEIKQSGLVAYDVNQSFRDIVDGHILYMRGNANSSVGHAWVADGYAYCLTLDNDTINQYIYCHWGWGGNCNGYYRGEVFELNGNSGTVYNPSQYFSVKKK